MIAPFILILFIAAFFIIGIYIHRLHKAPLWQIIIAGFYLLSFLWFCLFFYTHSADYTQPIDPLDTGYKFIASKHSLTYITFFFLYQIALYTLWIRKASIPPIPLAIALCILYIGFIFNGLLIAQLANNIMLFFPLFSLIIGIGIAAQTLNHIETNIGKTFLLSIILVLPVFVIITLILMLLGQEYNSISKGLTETTTWAFSKHSHPPHLPHQSHYLCTVAACGSPSLVKPLRYGKRAGQPIIVNRQLQIANAFEELITDLSPTLHRFIRRNYDKYGYDLSKKIKSTWASNLTYILMKPLEWFFLICLYTFCLSPETKIKKQYAY
ncbi:DUF6688 family protein [Capnocytophaga sp. oral taxon 878]|uniref:DUF6688 domain-containing protein n=1 Tax=Capnocytophaga sp. oral taxon 878 TaxID=1316596 RepID=UPI000D0403AE|nr:DUF6688 family protein [Capnocytophaga sp. oral taxon 878]AVM50587.1 hypothetical protein C4H12_08920 [Capnocytophaga sp. oral taxon 878]